MNSETLRIMIIIPYFNHSATLRAVVERALEVNDHVMVVDDGSAQRASDIVAGLDVPVIRHEKNRGKGAAVMTGAQEARRRGMTHIVTIDADGQHDPADFGRFVPLLREAPCAIVIGRRIFSTHNVPGKSRFGRKFSNFWFRLQTGQALMDTQSGFRAYPLAVLEQLKLREQRFSFEVEVIVKAAWSGVKIQEVDISVHYFPPEKRISHFHVFTDNALISLLNFRFTMRSVLPMPHRKILLDEEAGNVITVLHPIRSLRALLTDSVSPEKVGIAAGLGVFLGALPLIACHTVFIIFAASFFRLNKVVALSASQVCMPPFVPALCIETGYLMRHGRFLTEISMETIGHQGLERFYEWFIGSLVVGPVMAGLVGGVGFFMALVIRGSSRAVRG